ncbi:MAG: aminotransferase class III-fold pyridoxal phosphate-dependent enzyme, partial [Pseudomonadota bacterium]
AIEQDDRQGDFAVIGMACRFPGASDVDEFWQNLLEAKESISFFSDEELEDAGIDAETIGSPRYVKAKGIVDDADQFDAGFFEVSPLEADMLDPQQRIMLQLSWHALEDAGYPPGTDPLKAGVFVGANWPRYYQQNLLNNKKALARFGAFNAALGNEADFLSTRISYKLNLSGPSVNVFTACSTGLVAIAQACSALEKGQCDLALAGGVSISMPIKSGYMYQEGSMLSADGHCRTFDAEAAGTTFNDGAGLVVLKRLDHAERDGDRIYAVVKGCAVNNDGANKASYTAPSIAGQVAVYKEALQAAKVDPAKVGFIETHGTATPLGDPIEVASLAQCYSTGGKRCALGAVKSNIGHTIHASGVAGFIKAVLAVREGKIPATLHYQKPNPKLRLDETSFYVNATTEDWAGEGARIAAVSSLGVGGTNAHVIVQQHQAEEVEDVQQPATSGTLPFLISAKSEGALKAALAAHARFFAGLPAAADIADHAHTAAFNKPHFTYRTALFAKNAGELAEQLEAAAEAKFKKTDQGVGAAKVFMFTGQGSQRKQMGKSLLEHDEAYQASWREGCAQLKQDFGVDLDEILFGAAAAGAGLDIHQTSVAQPALFMLEYGIASWLIRRGCRPDYLIGHSVGEYAAAAIAGVLSFADALSIVAKRGQLMQQLPPGDMLAVFADREDIDPLLDQGVDLAGCNAPGQHVVSGEAEAIEAAIRRLERDGKKYVRLKTSHAFHSRMMKPMLEDFADYLRQFRFASAEIPIISTLTGKPLTDEEARSPDYWVAQIPNPVRFSDALADVTSRTEASKGVFIEVGPGSALTTLAAMHQFDIKTSFLAALPNAGDKEGQAFELHRLVADLWRQGTSLDWQAWFDHEAPGRCYRRRRLPLYAFDTKRHWIDPPEPEQTPVEQPIPANDMSARPQSNHLTLVTDLGPTPMAKAEAATNGYDKKSLVIKKLVEVFEDVTGFDLEDVEPGAHFSEAGLDSLMLTQIATALQQEFGGDITFRNLMEDYASFDDLAVFYLDVIPVDEPAAPALDAAQPAAAAPAAPQAAALGAAPAFGGLPQIPAAQFPMAQAGQGTLLEQVSLQLQLVQLQLQSLGLQQAMPQMTAGMPAAAAPAPAAPAPAARPASAAASGLEVVKSDEAKPKKSHGPGVRIAKQAIGVELSNAQRAWIDGKLADYQKTFAGSKAYAEEHRRYFADPRTVSGFNPEWKEIVFQLVVKGSKGSKLFDIDGNELIDITNGFGPIFFGHSPDFVSEAVKQQIDLGIETGPQSPLAGEVAKLFCDITGNERCTFASSGSEAVLGAIRLARTVTGRQTVVMFSGAYHGICDEAIARGGKNHQALPSAPGIMREALANTRVLPWAEEESIEILRGMKDQVAAVLVEPVQSRRPGFHDAGYIKKLREVTRDAGSALILDEVVTGFRVAPGGIQERFEVDADLAVYGKVVGGGYPIGIIGGKSRFMDALDGGHWRYGDDSIPEAGVTFFAGTFVRHPLALAATKAVLTKIQAEGPALYDDLEKKTAALASEARSFVEELECGVKFDEFASLFYISVPDTAHWGHLLYLLMQMEGVFVQQYRPCFLTTEHSEQDIEKVLGAFKRSLARLVEQGLIEGNVVAAKSHLSGKAPLPAGARLGRNEKGEPAYFVEDPDNQGQYLEVGRP